jgi:Ca2+/H+ antiporter, TMEM165/GDT1 family
VCPEERNHQAEELDGPPSEVGVKGPFLGVLMLSLVLSTYGIVFLAEIPDKTAVASLILATRFKVRDVVAGAWLAFLVQTAIAVLAGGLLHLLPAKPIHIASGFGFLAFAALALRRSEPEEVEEEGKELSREMRHHHAAWLTSFVVVFTAEMGDLTQLATAALVARTGQPAAVALGAILALWSVAVLAALGGAQAGRWLSSTLLNRASAAVFGLVGVAILVTALL